MKHSKSSPGFRPFEELKSLLDVNSDDPAPLSRKKQQKDVPANPELAQKVAHSADPVINKPTLESEREVFLDAVADVTPLSGQNSSAMHPHPQKTGKEKAHPQSQDARCLSDLITKGKGFVVADTPEYMEGTGYCTHPELAKRLHRGDFSIQAHIDLHGLNVPQAQHAFDDFLKEAIRSGYRTVLVIHGRGLSSPIKPILKSKVLEWLSSGPWRKWVIAFTSARAVDGGAGATYVLLRRRPLTKRFRKGKKYQRFDLR